MNNKNVFWGVILVVIGALFIFDNLGIFDFSFRAIFDLWPALLILWGISLLPIKGGIKTVLSIATVVLALGVATTRDYSDHWTNQLSRHHIRFNNVDWDTDDEADDEQTYNYMFNEDYDSSIEKALLNMDIAAGKFRIVDPTDYLIDFEAENNIGKYTSEVMKNGSTTEIYVRLNEEHFRTGTNKSRAYIKLNTNPLWKMKLDVGAADFNADLRAFKISDITIDGGASSIKLKIGDEQKQTHIDIQSGASSVKIYVPESAGCELVSESFLSDLDVNGFIKDGKVYRTANFDNAKQRIYIKMEAAISSLDIIRE